MPFRPVCHLFFCSFASLRVQREEKLQLLLVLMQGGSIFIMYSGFEVCVLHEIKIGKEPGLRHGEV